ncbi:hypothetical protein GE09DRAFT_1279023 [Coniochaeta sp. 2T2.1]|nr:hypothetical protein GE09DRAFT_1279023 [Coniochaeta sp. 2T2.1]
MNVTRAILRPLKIARTRPQQLCKTALAQVFLRPTAIQSITSPIPHHKTIRFISSDRRPPQTADYLGSAIRQALKQSLEELKHELRQEIRTELQTLAPIDPTCEDIEMDRGTVSQNGVPRRLSLGEKKKLTWKKKRLMQKKTRDYQRARNEVLSWDSKEDIEATMPGLNEKEAQIARLRTEIEDLTAEVDDEERMERIMKAMMREDEARERKKREMAEAQRRRLDAQRRLQEAQRRLLPSHNLFWQTVL